jgi:hypothetical protein
MTIKTWLEEIHGGKTNPRKASTPDGVIEALDYAIETYGSLGKRILKKHKISWKQTMF